MSPIGCKRDALRAVKGELILLGTGARTGWLDDAEKVVYKTVGRGFGYGPSIINHNNLTEHEVSERTRRLYSFVPRTHLWTVEHEDTQYVVLAMRYFPVAPWEVSPSEERAACAAFEAAGFRDIHQGNYRFTPVLHLPRIIDMELWDATLAA